MQHHKREAWKLSRCIEKFCEPEFISSEKGRVCHACDRVTDIIKRSIFWSLPKCLIIHLKRFTRNLEKLTQNVTFPDEMELNQVDGRRMKYALYAVCDHIGGLSGGHYTAHVISDDSSQWAFCDDESTVVSSREKVHSESAYILFYELIE